MAWVKREDGKFYCSICDSPKGSLQMHYGCVCNVETIEEHEQLQREWAAEAGEEWAEDDEN